MYISYFIASKQRIPDLVGTIEFL